MRISEHGIALIKHFEGFSPTVYLDAAGLRTIGFGHLMHPAEQLENISQEQAEQILRQDVRVAERAIGKFITVPLSQSQFDALCSFAFNVGAGALQRSTLRQKINSCEYDEIYGEFMKWIWAGGRKLVGLKARRKAEADLYFTDK